MSKSQYEEFVPRLPGLVKSNDPAPQNQWTLKSTELKLMLINHSSSFVQLCMGSKARLDMVLNFDEILQIVSNHVMHLF